jgi:hypothetical protein
MSWRPDDFVHPVRDPVPAGLAPDADDAISRFAAWARPKLLG